MLNVCARVGDKFKSFKERWDELASAKNARPLSDWVSKKISVFHGKKTRTYYRRYTFDGAPFVVIFDKEDEWILIAHAAEPYCEEDDEEKPFAGTLGVELPILVKRVRPDYPWLARKLRVEGRVILRAVVEVDGTVSKVCALSVNPTALALGEAAVAAIEQWQYEPATLNDEPVAVYFTVRADFELQ